MNTVAMVLTSGTTTIPWTFGVNAIAESTASAAVAASNWEPLRISAETLGSRSQEETPFAWLDRRVREMREYWQRAA